VHLEDKAKTDIGCLQGMRIRVDPLGAESGAYRGLKRMEWARQLVVYPRSRMGFGREAFGGSVGEDFGVV